MIQEQFKKHAGEDKALDQKELAEIWIKAISWELLVWLQV